MANALPNSNRLKIMATFLDHEAQRQMNPPGQRVRQRSFLYLCFKPLALIRRP